MSNFETHEVHGDAGGNLYFRMEGVWTKVTGTSTVWDKATELRRAYADDNNKLCYDIRGAYKTLADVESPKHPAPRPLSADESGTLYVYHDGAYTLITLA